MSAAFISSLFAKLYLSYKPIKATGTSVRKIHIMDLSALCTVAVTFLFIVFLEIHERRFYVNSFFNNH